jgi:hypothetical protein
MHIQRSLFLLLLGSAVGALAVPAPTITEHTQLQRRDDNCTPTITPDANGYVPPSECNALYSYYPSFGAAIAFSVLFGILTIAHFAQAAVHRAGFAWVILMSSIWECAGFVTRALSTRDQQDDGLATACQLLILLSPLCMSSFLNLYTSAN